MFGNTEEKPKEPKPTGPRVKIDPVSPQIFENPWYPLQGPPRNQQEQDLLEETIKQEQQKIHSELTEKHRDTKRAKQFLLQDARNNCADLELDWKYCLSSLNFDRFLNMCSTKHEILQQCIAIQSRNMERLQYYAHYTNPTMLNKIIEKADQMYLDELESRKS